MANPKFYVSAVLQGVDRLTPTIGKAEGGLRKFGKQAGKIGRNMTVGVTLPVIGMGASILKSAADFEQAMADVRASSAPGTTADDLERISKRARELGAAPTSNFNARQVAEGFGFLAKAGLGVDDMLEQIAPSLNAAAAGNAELGETTDGLLKTYSGAASGLVPYLDMVDDIVTTTDRVTVTQSEMMAALQKGGPIAKGLGQEWEDTVATMGQLAAVGKAGEEGGTAFVGAYAKLVNPVGETAKVLERFKITAQDLRNADGSLLNTADLLDMLADRGLNSQDVLRAFGTEAGPAFVSLFEVGSAPIRELARELRDNLGSAQRKAEIQMDTTTGRVKALNAAFLEFQLTVADSGLLEWFNDGARFLAEWGKGLNQTNPALLKWGSLILLGTAAVGPFLVIGAQLITMVSGLATAYAAMTAGQAAATTGLWAGLIPAVWGFTTALLANPITWLVVGIAAAVAGIVLLVKHWNVVVDALKTAWNWYISTWQAGFQWLIDHVPFLEKLIPDWLKNFLLGDTLKFDLAGEEGLADAAQAGAAAGGGQESHVRVDFANAPPGTTVTTVANDGGDLETDLGFAMASPG